MIVKNFRNKKVQTVIILLIILLSTMLINGALSIIITVKAPIRDLVEECQIAETTVYTQDVPESTVDEMIADFKGLQNVNNVYEVKRYYSGEDKFVDGRKLDALLFLTEYNKDVHKNIRCISGSVDVEAYAENRCAIPGCVANDQNIKVGDVITIKFAEGSRDFEVAGIYADPENLSIAFASNMYVKEVPEFLKTDSLLAVDVKEGVDPAEIESDYRKSHDGKLQGQMMTVDSRIDEQMMMINILGGVLLGIGIGSFAVCILIILFIVKNAVMSDTRKIAIYKTYGYRYKDILEMYLLFYSAVVFVGSTLGVLASLGFAQIILTGIFKDMGAEVFLNPFFPGGISVIVITTLVSACILLVLRKTKDIKPVFALRGITNSNTKKGKGKGGMQIDFNPFGIAMRSILRDKRGTLGIAVAAMAVVFLTNMAMVALEGALHMETENDYWLGIPSGEVVIEVNDTSKIDDMLKTLNADSRVAKATPWVLEKSVMLPWEEGAKETVMYLGVYEDYDEVDLKVLEGRNPRTKDEIALASKMADDLGLKVGDYMTISLDGIHDISMLVTGIYQTFYDLGKHGRVLASAYTERDVPFSYEKIAVYLKDDVNTTEFLERYTDVFQDDASVIRREECCKSIMTMIASPQKMAIPPVVGLILLIGGISIFSIVLLRNMKNEKTNQIYKSIGYTTADLYLSNIWYVTIIGVFAIIVGVPCLLLSYKRIMILALSVFGTQEYRMNINVMALVLINALTLLCFILSSLISSRRLKKINVRDLVLE